MQPIIKHFFHQETFTLTYVVSCPETKKCVVIDPVLDFDIYSGEIDCCSLINVVNYIESNKLSLLWSIETHAHADHVSAAYYLKRLLGCRIGCSKQITTIQTNFKSLFNFPAFPDNGQQFDQLFNDNDELTVGTLTINILSTPGHTADCVTYVIGKHAFIGDTLFMPDSGSARCDFPDGSAKTLYQSIQRIYNLGDDTTLYMCHDYLPEGRELKYKCTVGEQKLSNIQVDENTTQDKYIQIREKRDSGMNVPRLIYPSLQLNINAGKLPDIEPNQQRYLKLPLTPSKALAKILN
jgi:glyoxylase-like metal-dependent hydrolase (beta-lactamase superfamily II)